jgi:hypothetical protein
VRTPARMYVLFRTDAVARIAHVARLARGPATDRQNADGPCMNRDHPSLPRPPSLKTRRLASAQLRLERCIKQQLATRRRLIEMRRIATPLICVTLVAACSHGTEASSIDVSHGWPAAQFLAAFDRAAGFEASARKGGG